MKMKYKPMLAYPVSNKPIDYSKPVYVQPKLDGVRCLIQCDKGQVTAYSRTGKVWKNIDHILNDLIPFFAKHPNVVLDGELYNHDLRNDFEQIISIVRRQTPDDIDILNSAEMVQFHCYDIVNKRMKFSTRDKWLAGNLPESYCVQLVNTYQVYSHDGATSMHETNLNDGYE